MRITSFLLLFLCTSISSFAQTDEINISATFSTFIDLRIVGSSNAEWVISTIDQYKTGFTPSSNKITFQVASSNDFSVEMRMAPLADGNGNEVDLKNVLVRLFVPISRSGEQGTRWNFAPLDYYRIVSESSLLKSGCYFPTTTDKPILLPGPDGNAGTYEDNEFVIAIGLGRVSATKEIGMTSLLDQNISPGVYTSTMVLTAIQEAL